MRVFASFSLFGINGQKSVVFSFPAPLQHDNDIMDQSNPSLQMKTSASIRLKWVRYFIKFVVRYGHWDFFSDFNIEINTSCNRRCAYCPNSVFERGLIANERLMDEAIYCKLIDELATINFRGRLSPQLYGEPLLDRRLVPLMAYT